LHVAFPLSCWIALAGFLGCLSLFGLAVTRIVAPDGNGHSRGFFGGLAALVALFFFGGLGLLGLGATAVAIGIGSAASWNPVRRIEIERGPDRGPSSARDREESSLHSHGDDGVHARVTMRAGAAGELGRLLHGVVEFDPPDHSAWTAHRVEQDGESFDVYELKLPITDRDLDRLERDLEREIDGLDVHLPRKIDVELGPPDGR